MSISTIYRAASRLLETVNLEWDTVLGDRMQWLFALSVYNGMVTSSQAGFLSKDAIHFAHQAGVFQRPALHKLLQRFLRDGQQSFCSRCHLPFQQMCIRDRCNIHDVSGNE